MDAQVLQFLVPVLTCAIGVAGGWFAWSVHAKSLDAKITAAFKTAVAQTKSTAGTVAADVSSAATTAKHLVSAATALQLASGALSQAAASHAAAPTAS